MEKLFLEDLSGMEEREIKQHLITEYEAKEEDVERLDILIAYESVGSWGCDSSSFFLFRDKDTKKLYENHGSHCSCYGFEGQFSPEETSLEYLMSDKFYFSTGGYDSSDVLNTKAVKEYIDNLARGQLR